jgi:hypothetical protein
MKIKLCFSFIKGNFFICSKEQQVNVSNKKVEQTTGKQLFEISREELTNENNLLKETNKKLMEKNESLKNTCKNLESVVIF